MDFLKECVLDHVAIAVNDFEKQSNIYELLGFKKGHVEIVESQKVETLFFQVDTNAHIELLKPIAKQGPIQKFIDKKGEGIHHLSFKVKDIEKLCLKLKESGLNLIYDKIQEGANNTKINFIHPKSTGGVLIEIAQEN